MQEKRTEVVLKIEDINRVVGTAVDDDYSVAFDRGVGNMRYEFEQTVIGDGLCPCCGLEESIDCCDKQKMWIPEEDIIDYIHNAFYNKESISIIEINGIKYTRNIEND